MKKTLIILLLLTSIVLSGCQSAQPDKVYYEHRDLVQIFNSKTFELDKKIKNEFGIDITIQKLSENDAQKIDSIIVPIGIDKTATVNLTYKRSDYFNRIEPCDFYVTDRESVLEVGISRKTGKCVYIQYRDSGAYGLKCAINEEYCEKFIKQLYSCYNSNEIDWQRYIGYLNDSFSYINDGGIGSYSSYTYRKHIALRYNDYGYGFGIPTGDKIGVNRQACSDGTFITEIYFNDVGMIPESIYALNKTYPFTISSLSEKLDVEVDLLDGLLMYYELVYVDGHFGVRYTDHKYLLRSVYVFYPQDDFGFLNKEKEAWEVVKITLWQENISNNNSYTSYYDLFRKYRFQLKIAIL